MGMIAALVVIWVGFNILSDGLFLTPRNLWNLSVQSASVAIMATGMVLIIVSRNIDLSVGSVLGLTGMLMAMLQAEWIPKTFGLGFDQPWTWIVDARLRPRRRGRHRRRPRLRHRLRRCPLVHRDPRRAARLARPRLPARPGPDDRPDGLDVLAARRRAAGFARGEPQLARGRSRVCRDRLRPDHRPATAPEIWLPDPADARGDHGRRHRLPDHDRRRGRRQSLPVAAAARQQLRRRATGSRNRRAACIIPTGIAIPVLIALGIAGAS